MGLNISLRVYNTINIEFNMLVYFIYLQADQKRKKAIHKSGKCGSEVVTQALGLEEGQQEEEQLTEAMMDAQFDKNDRRLRELDLCMKGKTDNTQNAIVGYDLLENRYCKQILVYYFCSIALG